jgi:hypothetical protein
MAPFMRQDSQDSLVGHEICDLGNISRTPREVDATTRNRGTLIQGDDAFRVELFSTRAML